MGKKRFLDTDYADGGGLHVTVCALMVSSDDLNLMTDDLRLETETLLGDRHRYWGWEDGVFWFVCTVFDG